MNNHGFVLKPIMACGSPIARNHQICISVEQELNSMCNFPSPCWNSPMDFIVDTLWFLLFSTTIWKNQPFSWVYQLFLWPFSIAMLNYLFVVDESMLKLWFSIAMSVYQRVTLKGIRFNTFPGRVQKSCAAGPSTSLGLRRARESAGHSCR